MCKEINIENTFDDIDELNDTDREEMTRYYQSYNHRLNLWVKIDSDTGLIVDVKKSPGAYKNLPKKSPRSKKVKKGFFDFF